MKSKIGILTYHFTNNYGGLLQAYSLQKFLKNKGYKVDFINYVPKHVEQGGKYLNIFNLKNLIGNIKIFYMKIINLYINNFLDKKFLLKFDNFRKKKLGVNLYKVKNSIDLKNISSKYKILIAGSDQIWNTSEQFGLDKNYFLDFSPNTINISYAASFGKDKIEKKYYSEVKNLIKNFNKISVREKSGFNLLTKLTNNKITLAPDPTFLIDNFDSILPKKKFVKDDYIFCYNLRSDYLVRKLSLFLSKKYNLPIFSPFNVNRRWPQIGKTVYPGPEEWLSLMKNSKFIVTNTFHGVVFSILFKKEFIAARLPGNKKVYSDRIINLLNELGVNYRYIDSNDQKKIINALNKKIDWDYIDKNINKLKKNGENFIIKSLKEIKYA